MTTKHFVLVTIQDQVHFFQGQGQGQGLGPQGQGQGHDQLSSRRLEAKAMASRTPSLPASLFTNRSTVGRLANMLYLLPLVNDFSLVGICIDTDELYFPLITLYASIISPLIHLYFRVGRCNFLKRFS